MRKNIPIFKAHKIGDIIAARVVNSATGKTGNPYGGWTLELLVWGMRTGGTYDFGLGTNNDPSTAKVVLSVDSPGYGDDCLPVRYARTIYGTYPVRKVYPDNATKDEWYDANCVVLRIALNDYIYVGDRVTISIASGLYTQGIFSTNAFTGFVKNQGVDTYPRVIANWSYPGYERVTGNFTVRAVAFHQSANNGKPVRAVKFWATDGTNTFTTIVTSPTIDSSLGDAQKIVEYIGTINVDSLNDGIITCHFAAYPFWGDAQSVIDTSDGVNSHPTGLYAPQYYRLDKAGSYGCAIAVVDTSAGPSPSVVDSASFNPSSPPDAYGSIVAAANAIATYNNTNRSHNDCGGAIIYLKSGSYAHPDGTYTHGNSDCVWLTIKPFPGLSRSDVHINTRTGTVYHIGDREKIQGLDFNSGTTLCFSTLTYLWFDDCSLQPSAASTVSAVSIAHITKSSLGNIDFLRYYGTNNSARGIIRGCDSIGGVSITSKVIIAHVVIGNNWQFSSGASISNTAASLPVPTPNNLIVAFNKIAAYNQSAGLITGNAEELHGLAVIQNVFEVYGTSSASNCIELIGAYPATYPYLVNNVLSWYNTEVGQRSDNCYTAGSSAVGYSVHRKYWQTFGDIMMAYYIATDMGHSEYTANSLGYGNHALIHGVGIESSMYEIYNIISGLGPNFVGIMSIQGPTGVVAGFVSDKARFEGDNAGNGDYHLGATSTARNLVRAGRARLPYDLDGVARKNDGNGAAGAYEYVAS